MDIDVNQGWLKYFLKDFHILSYEDCHYKLWVTIFLAISLAQIDNSVQIGYSDYSVQIDFVLLLYHFTFEVSYIAAMMPAFTSVIKLF